MKPNSFILQAAEAEIARRIKRGELVPMDAVDQNLNDNLTLWTKMMTIAINKALGIGKKRFERDVQPILRQLHEEYFKNKEETDTEYAVSVIDRLYGEIME